MSVLYDKIDIGKKEALILLSKVNRLLELMDDITIFTKLIVNNDNHSIVALCLLATFNETESLKNEQFLKHTILFYRIFKSFLFNGTKDFHLK